MASIVSQSQVNNKKLKKISYLIDPDIVPSHYKCPISMSIMYNPVIAADGNTYESDKIRIWLNEHNSSPLTGLQLPNKNLVENINLKKGIQDWIIKSDWKFNIDIQLKNEHGLIKYVNSGKEIIVINYYVLFRKNSVNEGHELFCESLLMFDKDYNFLERSSKYEIKGNINDWYDDNSRTPRTAVKLIAQGGVISKEGQLAHDIWHDDDHDFKNAMNHKLKYDRIDAVYKFICQSDIKDKIKKIIDKRDKITDVEKFCKVDDIIRRC